MEGYREPESIRGGPPAHGAILYDNIRELCC